MELPNIPHTIRDAESKITYIVIAYRALTREEVVQAVRAFNASRKRRPARGSTVRIVTTIGA